MYDELQLDTLGDKKTALFLIMSDTDSTFNFLISMVYTQLFNLLCDKADDVYGGKLPMRFWRRRIGLVERFWVELILPTSSLISITSERAASVISNGGFLFRTVYTSHIISFIISFHLSFINQNFEKMIDEMRPLFHTAA